MADDGSLTMPLGIKRDEDLGGRVNLPKIHGRHLVLRATNEFFHFGQNKWRGEYQYLAHRLSLNSHKGTIKGRILHGFQLKFSLACPKSRRSLKNKIQILKDQHTSNSPHHPSKNTHRSSVHSHLLHITQHNEHTTIPEYSHETPCEIHTKGGILDLHIIETRG